MDYTIGIDTEELARFEISKIDLYNKKILSNKEIEFCSEFSEKKYLKFVASRFSCKESIFKAIGTGIGNIKFSDISILPDEMGKPIVEIDYYNVEVSISYTSTIVTTVAIMKKA